MLISLHNNVVYTQLDLVDKLNMLAQQFADWRCEVGSAISKPGKQSVMPPQGCHVLAVVHVTACEQPVVVMHKAAIACCHQHQGV